MTAPALDPATETSANPAAPDRKPRDDEMDVYGLTHPGKVRADNQDHFIMCALRKQMVVQQTSISMTDHLIADSQRLALMMMVADGVGGGADGAQAGRVGPRVVSRVVAGTT